MVGHEQAEGHAVETKARFQPEVPPPVERQLGHRDEQQRAGHGGQLLQQRMGGQPAHPELVDVLQAAQQGEDQQQDGVDAQLEHGQPDAGHGIGGGALVGRLADAAGKGGGYLLAVPRDMADLPAGQPEPH